MAYAVYLWNNEVINLNYWPIFNNFTICKIKDIGKVKTQVLT
jgi:hypothetical protein